MTDNGRIISIIVHLSFFIQHTDQSTKKQFVQNTNPGTVTQNEMLSTQMECDTSARSYIHT